MLDALGDPTRRSILEKLRPGPLAVGVLAGQLPISRPAVSQHLRVLKRAELVTETTAGTRNLYRLNQSGFTAVRDYLGQFWTTTLDNFAALAVEEAAADTVREAEAALDPRKSDPHEPDPHEPDPKPDHEI